MLKQYLIPKKFTLGDTPLEYVYTVKECDMRTRKSRRLSKYEWNASIESLFGIAENYNFAIKINSFGDIRLIAPDGKTAFSFYQLIKFNRLLGVDKEV
nr:MAG TPA: Protein of unknown function (DUF1587) [Caudoviricetes sp.]